MAASIDSHASDGISSPHSKTKPRNLLAACLAHALHDGYTDGLYAFLPLWQSQFGLSYAGLAIVRALYYGTMGGLQIPAVHYFRQLSPRAALMLSTLLAAFGFLVMALPFGFAGLCVGLVIAGIGASIQHPRGSTLVTDTYGKESSKPLGIYNFSGDIGKAALPALVAILLPLIAWRPVIGLMSALGVALTIALFVLAPKTQARDLPESRNIRGGSKHGFTILTLIGGLDTATRMGYLLFLPFLVHSLGGGVSTAGFALALLFVGGALGKATCGWLGDRLGIVGAVIATEAATALLIAATLATPLTATFMLLPLLGVVLNGTSSVLYGAVPDLFNGKVDRGFAIFYTSVIGSGGFAPILYGAIADHSSQTVGIFAAAGTAALIIPLVWTLRPYLRKSN